MEIINLFTASQKPGGVILLYIVYKAVRALKEAASWRETKS